MEILVACSGRGQVSKPGLRCALNDGAARPLQAWRPPLLPETFLGNFLNGAALYLYTPFSIGDNIKVHSLPLDYVAKRSQTLATQFDVKSCFPVGMQSYSHPN